MKDLLRKKKN